jgi:hypothetical protein
MRFARRRAAETLLRVVPAVVSHGLVPAQAVDCLDRVAVQARAVVILARVAAVWAEAVRREGPGLASRAKAIAPTSTGQARFLRGRVGKGHFPA